MLPIRSAELYDAAGRLDTLSTKQAHALRASTDAWDTFLVAGNSADFITAAAKSDRALMRAHAGTITEMSAVSRVLHSAADTVRDIEIDLDSLIRSTDAATQSSPTMDALLRELRSLGSSIDRACAAEINRICGVEARHGPDLTHYADASLPEIHESVLATASPEVRALAEQFPDARLLPSASGVVVAFGDLDTAPSVTTVVPGVGSGDPAGWAGYAARTQQIAQITGGAGVLWIGYQPPKNLITATGTAPAAAGAADLREFQAELSRRSARVGNEPHRVVVAHSYGSVVAGYAAQGRGLVADSLVLLGSPGVGASHATALNLRSDKPQVIAATSPADPIGLAVTSRAGVHGPDPADPAFGADRTWAIQGGHSNYWSDAEFHRQLQELVRRS